MATYVEIKIALSTSQKNKLKHAVRNKEPTVLEISKNQLGGSDIIRLTNTQLSKLKKLAPGKAMHIKMSKTQVGQQTNMGQQKGSDTKSTYLSMTRPEAEKTRTAIERLVKNADKFQTGGFLGGLAKIALPFLKNVLPKVLGTLGLAAATGAVSAATSKKVSGQGLKRAGYGIRLSEKEVQQLLKIAKVCENNGIIPKGSTQKYAQDIKEHRGGMLGTLATILGMVLPGLLTGSGLYRTGNKK